MQTFTGRFINATLSTVTLLGATGVALAESSPPSFVASPEIFKVISENERYRIIEVTLNAGQRSQVYAAPMRGVYFVTDCALLRHQPDIKSRESFDAAGRAAVKDAISSQSTENVGKSICKFVTFESK